MRQLESRKYFIVGFFLFFSIIYTIRLFYIQLMTDEYFDRAISVAVEKVVEYPMRGNIYDRYGKPLVQNEIAYDIMYTPYKSKIDTLKFCELIGITKEEFIKRALKAKNYSIRKASVFESLIKGDDFGKIREKLYQFKGMSYKSRTVRIYPHSCAAHVLGYLARVTKKDTKADEFYNEEDYKGSSGLERSYEKLLRGKKGYKYALRDINGNHFSKYLDGELDEIPEAGKDLQTSISIELQKYGEELMEGKRGAIIAIDPSTGEILAMISAPTYDPNLLVGRQFSKNYQELEKDPNKILFQRFIKSAQPPGSTIKTMQSLIALQTGVATENTSYGCNKGLVGCHPHSSPLNLPQAVQNSCNPYYYMLVKSIIYGGNVEGDMAAFRAGMLRWEKYTRSFGFGNPLGIDILGEVDGNVPDLVEYDKIYGKNHWNYRTIYSLSIGQGEFSVTPLHLANLAATIANKGYYITPHFVRKVGDSTINYRTKRYYHKTMVDKRHFDIVQKGMQWVTELPGGTARVARIDSVEVCGKTGTSQNPHGEDHSVFIGFAPRVNPKIAISVYVENGGKGGAVAAPIASLMMEKYLKGTVKRAELEEKMKKARFN